MERARPRSIALATVVDLARARARGVGRPALPAAPEPDLSTRSAQFDAFTASLGGYLAAPEIARIAEAYRYGEQAHRGQMRASGEEYITHPLAVAAICASWKLDVQAILAALLHDVVEDTGITKKDIAERFGAPVAELVDGVSKLDRIEFQSQEDAQAENFRKMLLAMARDVRVMLVKLADRLHNMRTLSALGSPKRRRIARETLEIHAPIAHRLGLNQVYRELQDLSFANLYPLRFAVISRAIKAARGNRREGISRILETIQKTLPEAGIQAQVFGREKHIYGIYRKMAEKRLTFAQVLDIYGFRIVVGDAASCYLTLGAMHALYKPVPGKFKDYIAIPKINGYQSLHTTLIGPYGTPIEVQVRTTEMHRIAEAGVAAHWLYKDDQSAISEVQQKTHQWLQSLLDIQNRSQNPTEFLEHVKVDLFPDEVYVFTPKGRIMSLPRGATAVDFAYNVHTDVGDTTIGVKINGEPMPLRTELKNGDSVEVLTHAGAQPNPAWLGFVRTGKARAHIRHFMKTRKYEESVGLGERLLRQALRAIGVGAPDLESTRWDKTVRDAGAKSRRDLLADIGLGKRLAAVVARKFAIGVAVPNGTPPPRPAPMTIRGTEGMAVQMAPCCRPIPGDPIIGQISKGQGLVVHTHDCPVIAKQRRRDPDNWVDVDWDAEPGRLFGVSIRVLVTNGRGILAKVAGELTATDTNITNVRTEDDETGNYANMEFAIEVRDRAHLARVMRALRRLQEVVRVSRVKS
jgi:RelA/SpoT family (p)ppGpp synthetase